VDEHSHHENQGGFPSKLREHIAQRKGRFQGEGIITAWEHEINEFVDVVCTHECCV
jgi:hypothetical protein